MKSLMSAVGLSVLLATAPLGAAMAQTVILVRHGEKADDSADPDLSEAGRARAQALAAALAEAGVTHVFTTPLKRTRQTAGPTAEAAGVEVVEVSTAGGAAHIARVAEAVRAAPADAVVLVAGHSNTVPAIARALGDPSPEILTDCDYDRLTVLTLDGEAARVVRGRYGARTESC